jgi:hypothetical protein
VRRQLLVLVGAGALAACGSLLGTTNDGAKVDAPDAQAADGGAAPDGATGADAGVLPDAASADAGADAAYVHTAGAVECAGASCMPASQFCCVGATSGCAAKTSVPVCLWKVECDQRADCTSGDCFVASGELIAECGGSAAPGAQGDVVLCGTDADCASFSSAFQACLPAGCVGNAFPYTTCGGACPVQP